MVEEDVLSTEDAGRLPELGDYAIQGELGETLVAAAMLAAGQIYRPQNGLDFGIDGVIELTSSDGKHATGRQIGVQVKRGLSVLRSTSRGRTLYFTEEHANYWLRHSLPVIVVFNEPGTDALRWRHVNEDTIRRVPKGFAIDLPEGSDLAASIDALRSIANGATASPPPNGPTLLIPFNARTGILIEDADLGIAAMEFSRTSLRGGPGRLKLEIDVEPDLVASIAAIRELPSPTAGERREAMIREDILDRARDHARKLERALTMLLTEPSLANAFGYDDELLADAVRRTAAGTDAPRDRQDTTLQAWPSHQMERPIVTFDVPRSAMDSFYDRNPMNRQLIRMGGVGGQVVGDLPDEVVASRFLPVLVNRLVGFADANEMKDAEALRSIGTPHALWLMGLN